jgi:hypothetical protein
MFGGNVQVGWDEFVVSQTRILDKGYFLTDLKCND